MDTEEETCPNGGGAGHRDDVMGIPWATWPLATLGHAVGISALFSEVLGHLSLPGFWSLEKGTPDRTPHRSLVSASHCCVYTHLTSTTVSQSVPGELSPALDQSLQ